MDEYEYCVIATSPSKTQSAADALTKLGHKGFRVISTNTEGGYIVWTMERRVSKLGFNPIDG